MNEILEITFVKNILLFGFIVVTAYCVGRALTKGFLRELDIYLSKKFVDYINTKKRKENGTKEEK